MFGSFPYEPEPDGAVFGPHHFYLGVLLILLVCWTVYDDETGASPWAVVGLTLLSVFTFALTWPYYPVVGALGTLVLLGTATLLATVRPFWWRYGLLTRGALMVGLLVALDDVLSHALGVHTPLDVFWVEYLHPYVSDPTVPSDVRIPTGLRDVGIPAAVRLLADLKAFVFEQVADPLAMVTL